MEPITSWSPETVSEWLKGLEAPLQKYPFSEWHLSGMELLQLTSHELEQLGVTKIGHQELILEAVEKLCALIYGLGGESLRVLTEKLRGVAHHLQMSIQRRWSLRSCNSQSDSKLPANELQEVLDLITAAKGLFSLLNRNQFSQLSGYTASRNIITLCRDLGTTVQKDITIYEKEKDIISICRQLVAVCDEILTGSPDVLLSHTARLESVDLVPVSPEDQLGIEIISTGSSNHYVTGTVAEFPADFCEKILAGDEVIQVNDQIVVGWSRKNLVKKLKENPNGVTLVLKKVPVSIKWKEKPPETEPEEGEEVEEAEEAEEEEEEEDEKRHSIFDRVAASVRSLSFRSAVHGPEARQLMSQEESEFTSDSGVDDTGTYTSHLNHKGAESEELDRSEVSSVLEVEVPVDRRSPSPLPQGLELSRSSISSCPEMGGHREDKDERKGSTKGKTTAMSRRRVSCRELGRPDSDGWLWKKRKETSLFMTQKWQRFWFVLKGPTLYWYTSQQDEKAEGLVKIGSYSIESAGEHKRKYVFKMCHQRFQNFFFAADNVNEMSKWINSLISGIQKHKKLHKDPPDSEEECYSETESEDEGSGSPRSHKKKTYSKTQSNTLPRTRAKKNRPSTGSTATVTATGGSKGAAEDEMGVLFHRLKEGGVSLIGHSQPITHDHFRKSFIRRNKNPVINEKAHQLRALQSTLKAKEAELQLINRILDDSDLTAQKFREWKECNEELLLEIERLSVEKERARTAKEEAETAEVANEAEQGSHHQAVGHAAETQVDDVTVSEGQSGAFGLRFSLGEELVDAELPGSLDTTTTSETSVSVDPLNLSSTSVFSDNYFFI